MRNRIITPIAALLVALPSLAAAQTSAGQLVGFGGLTFGSTTVDRALGGGVAVDLSDNVQLIGEAGHFNDVLPSQLGLVPLGVNSLLGGTPFDFKLSALYGEGGVRVLTTSRSPVRGYVEATAGAARLRTRFRSPNGIADGIGNAALQAFDSTEPLVGFGGGVLVQGGPLVVDLGYRYKRIFASDSLAGVLALGDDLNVSQARVGIGVRF